MSTEATWVGSKSKKMLSIMLYMTSRQWKGSGRALCLGVKWKAWIYLDTQVEHFNCSLWFCLGCLSSIPSVHLLKLCYVLIQQQMRGGFLMVLSSQNSILGLNVLLCGVFLLRGVEISLPLASFANTLGSGSCSDLRGGIQNCHIWDLLV